MLVIIPGQPSEFVGFGQSNGDKSSDLWWRNCYDEAPLQENLTLENNGRPNCAKYLVARDPRYLLPPKRGCVDEEITVENEGTEEVTKTVEGTKVLDAIWSAEVRQEVAATKTPDAEVNKKRSERLVPGTLEPGLATNSIFFLFVKT